MMGLIRRLTTALCVTALCAMTGCADFWVYPGSSGTSTGTTGKDFVYVANNGDDTVSAFVVGTGTLTAVSGSPFSLNYAPTTLVVNPTNTILYVASNSGIYAYTIGSSGGLTALSSGAVLGAANVTAMDISPDGKWLFALDESTPTLDKFSINLSTGLLSSEVSVPLTATPGTVSPQAVKVAPDGKNVFVALGTGGDMVIPLTTSDGTLGTTKTLSLATTSSSDNALTVDPNSKYLYVARSGDNGGVVVYSIANLSATPVTYSAGSGAYASMTNSDGSDIYVANRVDGTISGYSASSGVLTSLGTAFSSGSGVNALALDKTGSYLLASIPGSTSSSLKLYSFSSGALVSPQTVATGSYSVAIATTHP